MAHASPVEERLALRELIERYADAVNRVDAQSWGDTWADDGAWSLPDLPEIKGRDSIVAAWSSAMQTFPGVVFLAVPGVIDVDGDRATMRSYTFESYQRDGRWHRDCGCYEDQAVRTAAGWKFARRIFRYVQRS